VIIINLIGGATSDKGRLIYYTFNHIATSEYKDGKLEINVMSSNLHIKNIFLRMPFIRGIIINIAQSQTNIFILLVAYILDILLLKISLADFIYFVITVYLFLSIRTNKTMRELHGAEHMIFNYYNKYKKINMNEMDQIKKSSILSGQCGTNNYIINIVVLFLFKFIINDFMIRYFLMISLVYELNYLYAKYKTTHYLLNIIFKPTTLLQRMFFVYPPKDKDIEQAIRTVEELEKYEHK
jgi:uncharacterized protein YqhQ